MAYFVNRTDGNIAAVVDDGTINTETSLKLIGIGYPNYAETVAEDMVALLENFSNPNPPANPITGQTWFNSSIGQLEVFDGDIFRPINNVNISSSEPSLPKEGDFWYNDDLQQMFYRKGFGWQLISPSYSKYQGRTELAAEWLIDTSNFSHVALTFYNNGARVIIFSTDKKYRINNIDGFSWINPGINLPNYLQTQNGVFWAGNGNPYYSGGLVIGGTDGQLQYNHLGNLAGTTITTNGIDLTSTTGTFQALNLRANRITSSVNGYIFPDNTIQTTAAFNNTNAVNGSGGATQLAYFSDSTHLTGSASLTTDGRNLTMSDGMLSVNNILLTPTSGDVLNGIAFADGSIQYTAARNNYNAVNGTGNATQIAYFSDSTHVVSASGITTNGNDLTLSGRVTSHDLTVSGTFGRLTGVSSAQINLGDTTSYVYKNYSSIVGTPSNLGFVLNNNNYLTLSENSFGQNKTVIINYPLVFPDGTIQTTAATSSTSVAQIQSNWNQTNSSAVDYIKNKPTISNSGGLVGTGSSTQMAYFSDSTHVSGAGSITTNGVDLTVGGTLTAKSFVPTVGTSGAPGALWHSLSPTGINYYIWQGQNNSSTWWDSNNTFTVNPNGQLVLSVTTSGVTTKGQLSVDTAGIKFSDSTVQTSAGISAADLLLQFPHSFGASGYQKLPSGFIIQWGSGATTTGNGDTVTFPVVFPTAAVSVNVIEANAQGWQQSIINENPHIQYAPTVYGTSDLINSSFKVYGCRVGSGNTFNEMQTGLSYHWTAIGY